MTFGGYIDAKRTVPTSITLSATKNAGGPTSVTVTAGTYTTASLVTQLQTDLNAQRTVSGGSWTVSLNTATGGITIAVTNGTYSISWTSTDLRDVLGFGGNISSQSTSTGVCARGFWVPDRPLNLDGDPRNAQRLTDLRETEGPTGSLFGVVGNHKFIHSNLRWTHVAHEHTWDYWDDVNGTSNWERFLLDAHLGQGHPWFTPCSAMRFVDHNGSVLGIRTQEAELFWKMRGVRSVTPKKMSDAWTGAWLIEVPAIVSDGA